MLSLESQKPIRVNHDLLKVAGDTLLIFVLNLPFGYLRGGQRKFSFMWFLYIHLPVPLVILVRILSHIGFALYTYPLFVAAFFMGQMTGRKIYRKPG